MIAPGLENQRTQAREKTEIGYMTKVSKSSPAVIHRGTLAGQKYQHNSGRPPDCQGGVTQHRPPPRQSVEEPTATELDISQKRGLQRQEPFGYHLVAPELMPSSVAGEQEPIRGACDPHPLPQGQRKWTTTTEAATDSVRLPDYPWMINHPGGREEHNHATHAHRAQARLAHNAFDCIR